MAEPRSLEEYRTRLRELESRLARDADALRGQREAIRDDIIQLFREIDGSITELETMKESIRPLVDRYHELYPRRGGGGGVPRRDHLGNATYRERGWSALAGGEYERAVEAFERAIELDPEELGSRALLAWAYLRLGVTESARPLLEFVLGRDPQHSLGLLVQGALRIHEGRSSDAVEILSGVAAAAVDPKARLYAHLHLGIAHAEAGMYRDAQRAFRRALELGPNLTEAYWELGRTHHSDGRVDLALEAWRAGAENPFSPWGVRCLEAVQRLEASHASGSG